MNPAEADARLEHKPGEPKAVSTLHCCTRDGHLDKLSSGGRG